MKQKISDYAKGIWTGVVGTIFIFSAIGYFVIPIVIESKNDQIRILSEYGTNPEAIKKLEKKIKTIEERFSILFMVTEIDPLTGETNILESISGPSKLSTNMFEAKNYINEKKFDLALEIADKMQDYVSGFAGSEYIRYLVNKSKGFNEEAAKCAENIIDTLPSEYRHEYLEDVYKTLIDYYFNKNRKKEAEDLAIRALSMWPNNTNLKESFEKIFGYLPSSLKK